MSTLGKTMAGETASSNAIRRILRDNGLSLTLITLFLLLWIGQALAGQREYNDEQMQHGAPAVSLTQYLTTGHFLESTAENWESEFLQMGAYVLLTVFLFQRGSAESKKIGEREPVDRDPRKSKKGRNVPWPVRRGGWVLTLYSNSLTLAFLLLFLASWILHAIGGTHAYNEIQLAHGGETLGVLDYMGTSQFWFESFQNWQSEFLAIASMVVLSIFLRQRGSPESKPVDAPHSQTGGE
jgi:hypothetical protein